jgi:hypothetical protein
VKSLRPSGGLSRDASLPRSHGPLPRSPGRPRLPPLSISDPHRTSCATRIPHTLPVGGSHSEPDRRQTSPTADPEEVRSPLSRDSSLGATPEDSPLHPPQVSSKGRAHFADSLSFAPGRRATLKFKVSKQNTSPWGLAPLDHPNGQAPDGRRRVRTPSLRTDRSRSSPTPGTLPCTSQVHFEQRSPSPFNLNHSA